MRIGVIATLESDIYSFTQEIEKKREVIIKNLKFQYGFHKNKKVVAVSYEGIKVNASIATEILVKEFKIDLLIAIGMAEVLNLALNIGDIIVSTETVEYSLNSEKVSNVYKSDNDILALCIDVADSSELKDSIFFGEIVTGEEIVDDKHKKVIIEKHKALARDGELAIIGQVMDINKKPFVGIKSVATIGDNFIDEDNYQLAVNNYIRVVSELIEIL